MFTTSELYTENLNATEDLVINQGGTSSGKTYSIMQMLFTIAISKESVNILVVGQSIPNLKVGAITDAQSIVDSSPELQTTIKSYNKTDRIFDFHSGSTMQFKSFNDFQDAKSGKRDYHSLTR
jgi:phage terminase large subunit